MLMVSFSTNFNQHFNEHWFLWLELVFQNHGHSTRQAGVSLLLVSFFRVLSVNRAGLLCMLVSKIMSLSLILLTLVALLQSPFEIFLLTLFLLQCILTYYSLIRWYFKNKFFVFSYRFNQLLFILSVLIHLGI